MVNYRSVLEILTEDWIASGKRGQPTRAFIAKWRRENRDYGVWPLWAKFASNSLLAVRGAGLDDPAVLELDRATELPEVTERRNRRAAELAAWLEEYAALEAKLTRPLTQP